MRAHPARNSHLFDVARSPRPAKARPVVVLSNRAPFTHQRGEAGEPVVTRSASGLVTALEPLLESCHGTWVAHGAGSADLDVVDNNGRVAVPAGAPRYRLRYVAVPAGEHRGHYYGFANEGLWPLCHQTDVAPVFRLQDFRMYQTVNARFANAVREEGSGAAPLVFVQDYHFALAPRLLRQRLSPSTIVSFWHIPWPRPGVLSRCPWASELIDGLLGSDIVGVQTEEDRLNFIGGVAALLNARVDVTDSTITYRGHVTRVCCYPVGVEWNGAVVRATPPAAECRERVYRRLQLDDEARLVLGVDRLDYTKGINHKFLAMERLLERRPDMRGRLVLLQVAEPSRDALAAYQATRDEVAATAARINARFSAPGYQPIHLLERHCDAAEVYELYRAADVCYVGSLHDGMNLVAKEFVSARDDEQGVLLMSDRAGAARQLRAAVSLNPYQLDQAAGALAVALEMPAVEQSKRMRILRDNVRTYDAKWWARQLLEGAMGHPPRVESRYAQPIRRIAS